MGIALNIEYLEPLTDSAVDKAAASTGIEGALGWFADPLFFGEQQRQQIDSSGGCGCGVVALRRRG